VKLQPESARCVLRLARIELSIRIARVYEHADDGGASTQLFVRPAASPIRRNRKGSATRVRP
jgi:hypothetical protein